MDLQYNTFLMHLIMFLGSQNDPKVPYNPLKDYKYYLFSILNGLFLEFLTFSPT